jgi:hypothetical protein
MYDLSFKILTLPNDAGKTSSVDDGVHEDSKTNVELFFSIFRFSKWNRSQVLRGLITSPFAHVSIGSFFSLPLVLSIRDHHVYTTCICNNLFN